jgi:hypothetical protein
LIGTRAGFLATDFEVKRMDIISAALVIGEGCLSQIRGDSLLHYEN